MWKDLWKRSIALGDVVSWNVLMFLKIVTKWPEIQKYKLNNLYSHSILSRISLYLLVSPYLEILILLSILWRHFPAKNRSNWKKKIGFFGNIKFYHPAKFELKRMKNAKSFPGCSFASYLPTVKVETKVVTSQYTNNVNLSLATVVASAIGSIL